MKNIALLFICFILFFWELFAQTVQDKNQKKVENWLLSRVPSDKDTVHTSIENIIRSGLMPQAMERNDNGVFFFLSQTSPPSRVSKTWQLLQHSSERTMMKKMRSLAADDWVPISMDVQEDGAFVQYVKNGLRIINARIIKIAQSSDIENTVRIYRDLGFLPAAISTYKNELWFLFAQYETIAVENFQFLIKSGDAVNMNRVIEQGLISEKTQFVDMAITTDNKVIIVFMEPLANEQESTALRLR